MSDDEEAPNAAQAPTKGADDNDENGQAETHANGDHVLKEPEHAMDDDSDGDNYELSEYERLRLARIQRNRAKLAELGLEGKDGGGVLGGGGGSKRGRKKKKKAPSDEPPPAPTRSVPSRSSKTRARESIAAPVPTIKSLVAKKKKNKPKKDINDRMDKWIHQEFKRLKGRKTSALKQAERDVRTARREIKYWTLMRDKAGGRGSKSLSEISTRKMYKNEKNLLMGRTSKQFLREVDQRANELIEACELYDEEFNAMDRKLERETKRVARENELNLLESHDRFARALHDARAVLHKVLLKSTPGDNHLVAKANTRRSRRSAQDDMEVGSADAGDPVELLENAVRKATMLLAEEHLHRAPADSYIDFEEADGGKEPSAPKARDVGGWIEPSFAQQLDRSWLEETLPPESFELNAYVAQAGDTLLYYPAGHEAFLDLYPDEIGVKSSDSSRVPLWEQAKAERERGDNEEPWWTDEWIDEFDDTYSKHPLLCRVTHVHAEFPPDAQLASESSDGSSASKSIRLAVTLQPLVPSLSMFDNDTNENLSISLPPSFSVVTFPSPSKPFLVPFAWAYARSLTLMEGSKAFYDGDSYTLKSIQSMHYDRSGKKGYNTRSAIEELVSELDSATDDSKSWEIPLTEPDRYVILRLFEALTDKSVSFESMKSVRDASLLHVVNSTLPAWEGTTLAKKGSRDISVSSWEISTEGSLVDFDMSPDCLAVRTFERSLKMKLQAVIEFNLSDSLEFEFFYHAVDEEVIDDYGCAVPRGMFFERVLTRLMGRGDSIDGSFYRSISALLSDIDAIVDDAILYNGDDSDIVRAAVDSANKVKKELVAVARQHFADAAKNHSTDHHRMTFLLTSSLTGMDDSMPEWNVFQTLSSTIPKGVGRSWLDSCESSSVWVPQPGDKVQYSRLFHQKFLKAHAWSGQKGAELIKARSARGTWADCEVVSVMPFIPTDDIWKRSSFDDLVLLLVVALRFDDSGVYSVTWRPCSNANASIDSTCSSCSSPSFLRPGVAEETNIAFDSHYLYLTAMKKQCMVKTDGVDSFEAELLSKEDIRRGSLPLPPTGDVRSFEDLVYSGGPDSASDRSPSKKRSRASPKRPAPKSPKKPQRELKAIQSLVTHGFLPNWVDSASGSVSASRLEDFAEIVVCRPRLCLELVMIRLQKGYYRSVVALMDDIIESYGNAALQILYEAVTRKKKPASLKKILQWVTARDTTPEDLSSGLSDEELLLGNQVSVVHDLHATALAGVVARDEALRLHGIAGIAEVTQERLDQQDSDEDPGRRTAREKIRLLLVATDRDEIAGASRSKRHDEHTPEMTLNITLNDKRITNNRIFKEVDAVEALVEGETIQITIKCDGEVVGGEVEVSDDTPDHLQETDDHFRVQIEDCITFAKEDLYRCDDLVRFFFGKPGRMGPCARCHAYKRSTLVCRVHRMHSNCDFNWSEHLAGYAGVDGLLTALHPNDFLGDLPEGPGEAAHLDDDDAEENDGDDEFEDDDEELLEGQPDADEMLRRASAVAEQAEAALEDAITFAEAPVRLSKEFIDTMVPVDPTDSHYIYCIICGMSGDLLCCDGCANVVHKHCIGIEELPDDDWFCEECSFKERKGSDEGARDDDEDTVDGRIVLDDEGNQPYERYEFNEDRAAEIRSKLEYLRSLHLEVRKKKLDDERKKAERRAKRMLAATNKEKSQEDSEIVYKDDLSDFDDESGSEEERVRESDEEEFTMAGYRRAGGGYGGRVAKEINGPMDVLSDMNRRFLESIGITTEDGLLDTRTGDLAEKFGEWRRQEGLPKLAGTGNVASVSAWKTSVRNARQMLNGEPPVSDGRKRSSGPHGRRRGYHRKQMDTPFDALSEMNHKFLATIGIVDAEKLLCTRTSTIARAFAQWRSKEGLSALGETSAAASISMWKRSVRKIAREMGMGELAALEPYGTKPRRSTTGDEDDADAATPRPSRRAASMTTFKEPSEDEFNERLDPNAPSRRRRRGSGRGNAGDSNSAGEAAARRPSRRASSKISFKEPSEDDFQERLDPDAPPSRRPGRRGSGRSSLGDIDSASYAAADPRPRKRYRAESYDNDSVLVDEPRGVTERSPGMWQARLYYAGSMRYIGIFESREHAARAHEVFQSQLNDNGPRNPRKYQVADLVASARRAALEAVGVSVGDQEGEVTTLRPSRKVRLSQGYDPSDDESTGSAAKPLRRAKRQRAPIRRLVEETGTAMSRRSSRPRAPIRRLIESADVSDSEVFSVEEPRARKLSRRGRPSASYDTSDPEDESSDAKSATRPRRSIKRANIRDLSSDDDFEDRRPAARHASSHGQARSSLLSKKTGISTQSGSGRTRTFMPGESDVFLGRGIAVQNWPGNVHFRSVVNELSKEYASSERTEKVEVAEMVVSIIHRAGGRFIEAVDDDTAVEVSHERAIEKAAQAFRDLKPQKGPVSSARPTKRARRR